MLIKIILTVLFTLLNLFLYEKLQCKKIFKFQKNKFLMPLSIMLLFILYFVFNFNTLINSKVLIVNLIYSGTLIVFYFIFKMIRLKMDKRYEKHDSNFIENYIKILDFSEKKLIFILITIFQIFVIWDPTIIKGMNF